MGHRLTRICALLIVLASLVFSLPGPVLAMPFNAAANYAAGNEPISIATGDFNNDGKPDLAVVNYLDNNIGIYIGRGDGTFNAAVNYSAGASAMSVAVGDFNRDGKLDLVTANSNGGNVSVLIGNGDGTFNVAVDYNTGPHPSYVAVGDFSGDGKLDLAVPDNFNGSIFILIGNGDGTFNAAVEYGAGSSPTSVAVGEFNADGRLDLAVTNSDSSNVSVLKGNGDGTFNAAVNYNVGSQPYSVAVGDFNGDRKPDLAVANATSSNISILIGKGDGTFNAAVNYAAGQYPNSVAVSDFNCDGKPDLAIGNQSYYGKISIFIGKGDGTFDTPVTYNTGYNTWTVTVGDFNGDGSSDVAGANMGSYNISVLLNAAPCTYAPANVTSATVNTNLGAVNFSINAGSIGGLTAVSPATMPCATSGYYFPYGMFGFNITNLTAGQQVAITIRFPNPLPLGTRYYKCINGRMVDCSSLVTRVNEYTLILTLTDGGLGDADGMANGTIVDPGGPAFPLNAIPQSSSAQMPVTAPQKPVSLSNISVKSASLSAAKVSPGTPITVTASVANTGTGNGTSVVKVYVNGAEEAQQGVSVNSGSTSQVSFNVSRNEPGAYTVYVGGINAGSFTVDEFTPDTVLYISGALVFFALVIGVIWMARIRPS
jgi:hypothetical protein